MWQQALPTAQLSLYFNTGQMLSEKLHKHKWGAKVIDQISTDLQKEMPGLRGFSSSNLRKMRIFYDSYKAESAICSLLTNKLNNNNISMADSSIYGLKSQELELAFYSISFTHHFTLILKAKDIRERLFYIRMAASESWSVSVLEYQIESKLFERQGNLPHNFESTLSKEIKPTATQIFKDEYLVNFIGLEEDHTEHQLEEGIVFNIRDFILRMGKGFAFMGNQYCIRGRWR